MAFLSIPYCICALVSLPSLDNDGGLGFFRTNYVLFFAHNVIQRVSNCDYLFVAVTF